MAPLAASPVGRLPRRAAGPGDGRDSGKRHGGGACDDNAQELILKLSYILSSEISASCEGNHDRSRTHASRPGKPDRRGEDARRHEGGLAKLPALQAEGASQAQGRERLS